MKFLQDISYTIKMVRGLVSGFDGLQRRCDVEDWEYIEYSKTEKRDYTGEYHAGIKYDLPDLPFYVCVAWKNRTHTPLPIILDAESEHPFQNTAARFLNWLWEKTPFCPRAFQYAFQECAYYEHQYTQQSPSPLEENI